MRLTVARWQQCLLGNCQSKGIWFLIVGVNEESKMRITALNKQDKSMLEQTELTPLLHFRNCCYFSQDWPLRLQLTSSEKLSLPQARETGPSFFCTLSPVDPQDGKQLFSSFLSSLNCGICETTLTFSAVTSQCPAQSLAHSKYLVNTHQMNTVIAGIF